MARKIVAGSQTAGDNTPLLKELRVDANGNGFVTFRGVARICGISHVALVGKGADIFGVKLTEKLISAGFSSESFPEWRKTGIPKTAVEVIVHYYAFEAGERCTDAAKKFLGAINRKPKESKPGQVYVIGNLEHRVVKIGTSKNIEARIKALQISCPYKLQILSCIPGDRREEVALHRRFASFALEGEWFSLSPEIMAHFDITDRNHEVYAEVSRSACMVIGSHNLAIRLIDALMLAADDSNPLYEHAAQLLMRGILLLNVESNCAKEALDKILNEV